MKCAIILGRLLNISMAVALVAIPTSAQTSEKSEECQPKEFIERLWRSATKGDLLTADGWQRASGFFFHPNPWPQDNVVTLAANNWTITGCTITGSRAEVTMAFQSAGRIDSNLRYLPLEAGLVESTKRYHFVLAPTHWNTYKPDGSTDREITGAAGWQIEDPPDSPWTTVNTAIRYVLAKRNDMANPTVKANADQTLSQLMKIAGPNQTTFDSTTSPTKVVEQLWIDATNGILLTPEGRNKTSHLFTQAAPTLNGKTVHVIDNDWAINDSAIKGDTAKIMVGYADAGQIDTDLRYIPAKPTKYFKTGFEYWLVVAPEPSKGSNEERNTVDKEKLGPPRWQIKGSPNIFLEMPWTTVNTAIRYVLEVRSKTTDPVVKKNADNTLTALLRYR